MVVVTGVASGIGREVAILLARSGLTISAWDIEEAPLSELVSDIRATGGAVKGVLVDLGDQHAIDAAWEDASSMGLPIPYLVNNAGPPSTTDVSVVEGLRLAVGSYVAVTEDWLGRHAADASSMTFTSSVAGNFFVGPTTDWYPTAKAGIAGYMRHCAVELRGRPRSNGVAPTGVVTRREMSSRSSSYPLERRFSLLPTIPITGNVPLGSCCKNSASIIVPQRWVTKDNVSLRVRSPSWSSDRPRRRCHSPSDGNFARRNRPRI